VNLPVMNAMNFPAAILQPPYFDPNRPVVMDYGATGATIGHEISHSFDDQGALFDEFGKLNNWWKPEDFAHFLEASQKLAKQYDQYKPFPDLALNGQQVLSENIADLAGLSAAYDAWQLSLHGKPAPVVDGFSGDQQFFMSYAQSWRGKATAAPGKPTGRRSPVRQSRHASAGNIAAAVDPNGRVRHVPIPEAWTQRRVVEQAPARNAEPLVDPAPAKLPEAPEAGQGKAAKSPMPISAERKEELRKAFRPDPNLPPDL